jgi:hypothetical protein
MLGHPRQVSNKLASKEEAQHTGKAFLLAEEQAAEKTRKKPLQLEEEKRVVDTLKKDDDKEEILFTTPIPKEKPAEVDAKQKQLEERVDHVFLSGFKPLLSKYQLLKDEIDKQIAIGEEEEAKLLSLYKSNFYSPDAFVKAADFIKDEKDEATLLDNIKKAPVVWPADTLSRRLGEYKELKTDIERYENRLIEEYRSKMVRSLKESEDLEEKKKAESEVNVVAIKRSSVQALQAAAIQYATGFELCLMSDAEKKNDSLIYQGKVYIALVNGAVECAVRYKNKVYRHKMTADELKITITEDSEKDLIKKCMPRLDDMLTILSNKNHILLKKVKSKYEIEKILQKFSSVMFIDSDGKPILSHGFGRVIGKKHWISDDEAKKVYDLKNQQTEKWTALIKAQEKANDQDKLLLQQQTEKEVKELEAQINYLKGDKIFPRITIENIEDYLVQTKSLSEIEELFNEVLQECYAQSSSFHSSRSLNLLRQQAEQLTKNSEHVKYDTYYLRLKLDREELIKDRVVEVAMQSVVSPPAQILEDLLTQSNVAIQGFNERLSWRNKFLARDAKKSEQIRSVADKTKAVLKKEAFDVNKKLKDVLTLTDKRLVKVEGVLNAVMASTKELEKRCQEMQAVILRRVDDGELENKDLEPFVEDARERATVIETKLIEENLILHHQEKTEELTLHSIDQLYALASFQLEGAKSSLGGSVYHAKYQKAFDVVTSKKSDQARNYVERQLEWKVISDTKESIIAYAKSALPYSQVNKNATAILQECKATVSSSQKVIEARNEAIALFNPADQSSGERKGREKENKVAANTNDLMSIPLIKDNAEKDYKAVEASFTQMKQCLANAAASKLAAENAFAAAKKNFPDISADPYQKMVDHANQVYDNAVKETIKTEEQLLAAKKALQELKIYAVFAAECDKLHAAIDQLEAGRVQFDRLYHDLNGTSVEIKPVEVDVKAAVVVDTKLDDAKSSVNERIGITLPLKIEKRIEAFVDQFGKAEALLSQQKTTKKQFLQTLDDLKKVVHEVQEEKTSNELFNKTTLNQYLSAVEARYQAVVQKMGGVVGKASSQKTDKKDDDPLASVLSKKIPERIIENYSNAVAIALAKEKKEIDEQNIITYLKKFLERKEKDFSKEIPIGGTKLQGRDIKIQKALAGIYNDIICDDKKTGAQKLKEIEQKIKNRLLKSYGFFRKEDGFADQFSKTLSNVLSTKKYCFEDIKTALDRVENTFAGSSLSSDADTKYKKRGR